MIESMDKLPEYQGKNDGQSFRVGNPLNYGFIKKGNYFKQRI